jgi:two-component system sensor histidine kinase ChvG
MSQSLRHRIDNIEAFAATLPMSSKPARVSSFGRGRPGTDRGPALRKQLIDVVRRTSSRLDRLIGDVGERRTDAELARARFEPVDLNRLSSSSSRHGKRGVDRQCATFARPRRASARRHGRAGRFARHR